MSYYTSNKAIDCISLCYICVTECICCKVLTVMHQALFVAGFQSKMELHMNNVQPWLLSKVMKLKCFNIAVNLAVVMIARLCWRITNRLWNAVTVHTDGDKHFYFWNINLYLLDCHWQVLAFIVWFRPKIGLSENKIQLLQYEHI